jgi:hypothetical protein
MTATFITDNSAKVVRSGGCLIVEHAYQLNGVYYDVRIEDSQNRDLTRGSIDSDLIYCVQGHWRVHLQQLQITSYQNIRMTGDHIYVDQADRGIIDLDATKYKEAVGAKEGFESRYTQFNSLHAMEYFAQHVLKTNEVAMQVFSHAPMPAPLPQPVPRPQPLSMDEEAEPTQPTSVDEPETPSSQKSTAEPETPCPKPSTPEPDAEALREKQFVDSHLAFLRMLEDKARRAAWKLRPKS